MSEDEKYMIGVDVNVNIPKPIERIIIPMIVTTWICPRSINLPEKIRETAMPIAIKVKSKPVCDIPFSFPYMAAKDKIMPYDKVMNIRLSPTGIDLVRMNRSNEKGLCSTGILSGALIKLAKKSPMVPEIIAT